MSKGRDDRCIFTQVKCKDEAESNGDEIASDQEQGDRARRGCSLPDGLRDIFATSYLLLFTYRDCFYSLLNMG